MSRSNARQIDQRSQQRKLGSTAILGAQRPVIRTTCPIVAGAKSWLTQRFWDAHSSGGETVASRPGAMARRRDLVDAVCSKLSIGAKVVDLGSVAGHGRASSK